MMRHSMSTAPIRFGVWAPVHGPRATHHDPEETYNASWEHNRDVVLQAEALGFDSTLIAQHTINPHQEDLDQLETWSSAAALAALSSRIKAVRRALGDDGVSQHVIRTVRGRGYQFVGALRTTEEPADEPTGDGADLDEVGTEVVLNVRRLHLRRVRTHGNRYRVAPSTRRREFHGPPR